MMNEAIIQQNLFRSGPLLKLAVPVLILSLGALAFTGYKTYVVPWRAYGNGDMSYLQRVDPRSLSGGDLTHYHFGAKAFEQEAPNMGWGWSALFDEGDGVFERMMTPAVESNFRYDADGVGPIYNHHACGECHFSDGRAAPQLDDPLAPQNGLLFRLSVPGQGEHGGPKPHPVYGGQFGDRGLPGKDVTFRSTDYANRYQGEGAIKPEGRVEISYRELPGRFADGTLYSLRQPHYEFVDLNYGELDGDFMFSPRIAPAVIGQGLLEAIPAEAILRLADPDDQNGDGISGKAQRVWDPVEGRMNLGRFGWKMETASVAQQAMDAAVNDMGVTNPMFPAGTCTPAQSGCLAALSGGEPEFTQRQMDAVVTYLQLLGVPGRRGVTEAKVQAGEQLFRDANCTACHTETFVTGEHAIARLKGQTIHPYTDMLLHDMGEGLADHRPSFEADGREWRTAPLWGIGLVPKVNGHSNYLHDGRARDLNEAILWHGGEAEASKQYYSNLSKAERDALLFFLESL